MRKNATVINSGLSKASGYSLIVGAVTIMYSGCYQNVRILANHPVVFRRYLMVRCVSYKTAFLGREIRIRVVFIIFPS